MAAGLVQPYQPVGRGVGFPQGRPGEGEDPVFTQLRAFGDDWAEAAPAQPDSFTAAVPQATRSWVSLWVVVKPQAALPL